MRAIAIAGLPGSGKTWLARDIAGGRQGWHLADDPVCLEEVTEVCSETEVVVVCHPDFCLPHARLVLEEVLEQAYPGIDIEWVFFANDPAACLDNIRARDDGRNVEGYVGYLSRFYSIPDGCQVLDVYRPNPAPAQHG